LRRKGLAIGVVICALLVTAVLGFDYVDRFMGGFGACRIVILSSMPSPNGSKSVVTFKEECGATVPNNTQASIASTGNAFSPEEAPPFLSVRGDHDISATWTSENLVRIGLIPREPQVYRRESRVGDVRIDYE
jgi:hypothetical protein